MRDVDDGAPLDVLAPTLYSSLAALDCATDDVVEFDTADGTAIDGFVALAALLDALERVPVASSFEKFKTLLVALREREARSFGDRTHGRTGENRLLGLLLLIH